MIFSHVFRVLVPRRGQAQLFVKGGIPDEDEDHWGLPAASWYGIVDMPEKAKKVYKENRKKAGQRLRRKRAKRHKLKPRKVG